MKRQELARHLSRERADHQRLRSRARAEKLLQTYESGHTLKRLARDGGCTVEWARQLVRRGILFRRRDDIVNGRQVRDFDSYYNEAKARNRAARAPRTDRFKGETS